MREEKTSLSTGLFDEEEKNEILREMSELSVETALAHSILEGREIEVLAANDVDDIGLKIGITCDADGSTLGVSLRRKRCSARSMRIYK